MGSNHEDTSPAARREPLRATTAQRRPGSTARPEPSTRRVLPGRRPLPSGRAVLGGLLVALAMLVSFAVANHHDRVRARRWWWPATGFAPAPC